MFSRGARSSKLEARAGVPGGDSFKVVGRGGGREIERSSLQVCSILGTDHIVDRSTHESSEHEFEEEPMRIKDIL
jgi:hypothetical protein